MYIIIVIIVIDMMIVFKYLIYLMILFSGDGSSSVIRDYNNHQKLTSKNKMEASI